MYYSSYYITFNPPQAGKSEDKLNTICSSISVEETFLQDCLVILKHLLQNY